MLKNLLILLWMSVFIAFPILCSDGEVEKQVFYDINQIVNWGGKESRFQFIAQDMETLNREIVGTSKIRNIAETLEGDILCLGQLKTLFGDPLYMTKDLEEQYRYCIMAVDGDGKEIYLDVYSGPSGPAIGGRGDADSKVAADELAKLIVNAEPTDYDYEGFYLDTSSYVKEGVHNGKPYWEESGIKISAEEVRRQLEEVTYY